MTETPSATGPRSPHDRTGRRLRSLDLLRGLTVLGMIMVNATSGIQRRDGPVFPLLLHARWTGFTVADAVFPAFILMVGVSIAISSARGHASPFRILARGVRLTLLGLLLSNMFYLYDFESYSIRLPGVLQRIGIVYAIVALIYRQTRWQTRLVVAAGLLILYWPLCLVPSPDGTPTNLWMPGHNFVSWMDRAALGPFRFVQGRNGYDPEGLLSTFPVIAQALIGTLAGDWLRCGRIPKETSRALTLAAGCLLTVGLAWGLLFPIAKNLWTSSFVLVSSGITLAALALLHLGFDQDDVPLRRGGMVGSFGRNAIAAYSFHEIASIILTGDAMQVPFRLALPYVGTYIAALLPVAIFTALIWWPLRYMDQRGWYLKI